MLLGVPTSPLPWDAAGGQDPRYPVSSPSSPTVDEAAEGLDSASAGALWHRRLLPLGSLSSDARSRAVALVQQLRQKWLDTLHHLAQLRHILDVVRAAGSWCWGGVGGSPTVPGTPIPTVPFLPQTETVQQGLEEPLCDSQEMWACRNQVQANPCPHPACPATQARPAEGCGTPAMLPGQALAAGRMLAQRLQDALVQLQAQVGQLPALLRQAARQAQHGMAELPGTFSQTRSLQELLGTVVARGREVVAQASEALVVFLFQHPTVPWLEDADEAAGTAAPRTTLPHPQT